jgi:hypothetical protein
MKHTAQRKFSPTATSRLPGLLAAFGCADVVATVDEDVFAKKAGELISQITSGELISRKKAETVTPTVGKYRLRALQCEEVAAQTRDPYAKDILTVLAREFMQAAHQAERRKG